MPSPIPKRQRRLWATGNIEASILPEAVRVKVTD